MKQTYSPAMRRATVICAALLALATPSVTGQTIAENGAGRATSNRAAKQVAPAHPTLAKPQVTPPQIPVAMVPEEPPAQAPRVSFNNGQLTIDAQNSILKDVLNAICRQIGAQLDMDPGTADSRVAASLSGPPRQVISALLDDPDLNYIIVGLPESAEGVQKVLLRKKLPAGSSAEKHVAENVPVATQSPVATQAEVDTAPLRSDPVAQAQAAIVLGSDRRQSLVNPVPATKPPQPELACDDMGLPPNCHDWH